MGNANYQTGIDGETIASQLLKDEGFVIIERNFRSHHGEIDIIAMHKDILVFVEVKNYSYRCLYKPIYAVSKTKKTSIIFTAKYYIHKMRIKNTNCRFDIVTIYRDEGGQQCIDHFVNAFGL